jgi:hypothetical protein
VTERDSGARNRAGTVNFAGPAPGKTVEAERYTGLDKFGSTKSIAVFFSPLHQIRTLRRAFSQFLDRVLNP